MAHILVIDDQPATLELLAGMFRQSGYAVDAVGDGARALEYLQQVDYDVVFTDLRLGYPYDGLEVLDMVKKLRPRAQVVIMTAFSSVESSVLAMKAGAYDYIAKPFKKEEVMLLAARAAERAQLDRRLRRLEASTGPVSEGRILGGSPEMVRLMRVVAQVARTDATVLITGESGTGKELVARTIHEMSPRRDRPFVAVNCGAIPENLQESEFFGHVRGAFTGAARTRPGLVEQADSGTLFLDEVGETTLTTQVKLLRFLQEGEVRKVGDDTPTHVDVRLVAATNRDLTQLITRKQFREDLYYRLNIIAVEVPALRDRGDDILLLARFFLERIARKNDSPVRGFAPEALRALREHRWPGNVRELENAVERAVTLAQGLEIGVEDLPPLGSPGRSRSSAQSLPTPRLIPALGELRPSPARPSAAFPTLAEIERRHIEHALSVFGGNRARAARALGIGKATLWRKLRQYGAAEGDERPGSDDG